LAGLAPRGFLDASNDEETIRRWWSAKPDANVGIATGASGLLVVDVDHGLEEKGVWPDWLADAFTYTVRTGRRPEFGLQFYFQADGSRNSAGWAKDGLSGDIRADGGYVLAAGSIHPSGHPYEVWFDGPLNTPLDWVTALAPEKQQFDKATAVDDVTADWWKTWLLEYAAHNEIELRGYEKRATNGWWLGIRCPWADEHGSGDGTESSTVLGILDGMIAFECSHGTCKAANRGTRDCKAEMARLHTPFQQEPGQPPSVILGSGTGLPMPKDKKEPVDWRTLFHTKDEVLNCPPPTFLIENFLAKQAICAIAAPVAQRKSLIALNMARSLCTGEPLFGFLPVLNRPSRVLYLCPEMGLISFAERVRRMDLSEYAGESLFIRSMNMGNLNLADIPDEALRDSVLIVDTAIRFMKGDENSSADMQAFSETLFSVQRRQGQDGAIVILYHSPKATKDASELTLENCMRGSGELGAAITDAHGTRLQEPENAYKSASFIRHIKQRDYQGLDDFEVSGDIDTGVLTKSGEGRAVLAFRAGFKANRDGKDEAARAVIHANPDKSLRELVDMLAELGIKRGKTWISDARLANHGESKLSSAV
jgi:hypothetical protein